LLGISSLTLHPAETRRVSVDPSISTAIQKASAESGSPFELLMASAQIESGLKSDAKAGNSSAVGLFQFTEQTWLDTVRRHGAEHGMAHEASAIIDQGGRLTAADPATRQRILNLRTDLSAASALAGDHLHDLSNILTAALGRAATAGEVYLGHFLGAHGAKQIIAAPQNQPAANVLPEAARANSRLFYAADGTPYTTGQFLQHVQTRLKQAFADVGSATPSRATNPASADRIASGPLTAGIAVTTGPSARIPPRIQSASERQAMASLMEPLLQHNQYDAESQAHRSKRPSTIPAAVLAAMRMMVT
jgi:hypothetical protein